MQSSWKTDAERIAELESRLEKYDKQIGPFLVLLDRGIFIGRMVVYLCGIVFAVVGFGAALVSIVQYVASLKK